MDYGGYGVKRAWKELRKNFRGFPLWLKLSWIFGWLLLFPITVFYMYLYSLDEM